MKRHAAPTLALLAVLIAALVGCSDSTSPDPSAAGEGRLKLNLIDAPGEFDQVNIVVIGVTVHRSDEDSLGGWHTISDDTFTVDLLTLTDGHGVVLADSLMPAGDYTQIRLLLGEGCHVIADGVRHDLEVPSGDTSGLKLNHPFTLAPGAVHEATLDFDAHRSIHVTGNGTWKMKPVIRVIVNAVSGGLGGTVLPVDARAQVWAVMGTDSALAWADTLTGAFALPMLPTGAYDVTISATAGSYADSLITDVMVEAGSWHDLGTVELEDVVVLLP